MNYLYLALTVIGLLILAGIFIVSVIGYEAMKEILKDDKEDNERDFLDY